MKTGFAIVIGSVISMEEGGFQGKDGTEVKKVEVMVATEDAPLELEGWGKVSEALLSAGITEGTQVIFKCKLVPREWEYQGKTCRRTSIRIEEYECISQTAVDVAKEVFDAAPF